MYRISFTGDLEGLTEGISALSPQLGISEDKNGDYTLKAVKKDGGAIDVVCDGKDITVTYGARNHFFRALGLVIEHLDAGEKEFSVSEPSYFTMNGPMFDVSQGNSVINVKSLKKIIRSLALMGLNTLMVYCEDSYEVKERPYFGYMRARYSEEDMSELDAYADSLGIEMIPCIQTLAHMPQPLRWKVFHGFRDYEACLMVGEEETYKFVEDLIRAASRPFRTKKIHIGMDEAWKLGRGKYLDKHGYTDPSLMMKEHLAKVYEITERLGLEPMMWDDMYYRTFGSKGYYQFDTPVPEATRAMVPEKMSCIYWDYYHNKQEEYEKLIRSHKELSDKVIFAGGIWTWTGFGLRYKKTVVTTESALNACKKLGIDRVFMTTWGDNGTECLINTTLIGCQLYAEHQYADKIDYDKFAKRFRFCTGGNVSDFDLLEDLDRTPDTVGRELDADFNSAKYLMWQDVLTGLFDKNIEGVALNAHYEALEKKLAEAEKRNGDFNGMFEYNRHVANVLAVKSEIGLKLTAAYKAGDKTELRNIAENVLPDLFKRVSDLRDVHMKNWFDQYKALGWDIMDMRYGSLLARIDSAITEIKAYLAGETEKIEELEEERLYYDGKPGPVDYANYYSMIVSASTIAPIT